MHATTGSRTMIWILVAVAVLANAAGYVLGLWSQIGWFDEVVHAYTSFAVTLLLAMWLYDAVLTGAHDHGALLVLAIGAVGVFAGVAWEFAEWGFDRWFTQGSAIKGKEDTMFDLLLDTGGALAAGLAYLPIARDPAGRR